MWPHTLLPCVAVVGVVPAWVGSWPGWTWLQIVLHTARLPGHQLKRREGTEIIDKLRGGQLLCTYTPCALRKAPSPFQSCYNLLLLARDTKSAIWCILHWAIVLNGNVTASFPDLPHFRSSVCAQEIPNWRTKMGEVWKQGYVMCYSPQLNYLQHTYLPISVRHFRVTFLKAGTFKNCKDDNKSTIAVETEPWYSTFLNRATPLNQV